MSPDFGSYAYYIRPGATDSRKSWGKLGETVENEMRLDVHSKAMFLFCNGRRNCLKILAWDNGYWVLSKRLVSGTFCWPMDEEEARRIGPDDVRRLISGEDIFRKIPEVKGKVFH